MFVVFYCIVAEILQVNSKCSPFIAKFWLLMTTYLVVPYVDDTQNLPREWFFEISLFDVKFRLLVSTTMIVMMKQHSLKVLQQKMKQTCLPMYILWRRTKNWNITWKKNLKKIKQLVERPQNFRQTKAKQKQNNLICLLLYTAIPLYTARFGAHNFVIYWTLKSYGKKHHILPYCNWFS